MKNGGRTLDVPQRAGGDVVVLLRRAEELRTLGKARAFAEQIDA
jgi:hypothetical protein